ncbi:MAG: 3-deoxy-7-phosphoheptulonate synthase, partial [Candidatus Methylacidiphilales bacterium]|nr:3-deoxy-7-phosphoheptulonate synthase [Candidatus Methylacidiphilales bacterium]
VAGRQAVRNVIRREDPRILVVLGPCSVHDPDAAWDYAQRLEKLRPQVEDCFLIVMRAYFEKPRTTIGWKGLIYDPHLDNSSDIAHGLRLARTLLVRINELGLPAATEFLDPIVPQYIAELVSWAAIGARTTESQTHRQMASGLSMPVGFKNGTDGELQAALDAMSSAMSPHSFLGIDGEGCTSVVRTTGNPWGHVVLRGGHKRTNYDPESIADALARLQQAGLSPVVMVDCSHANSGKVPARQEEVWQSILTQRLAGNHGLIGAMLESNLAAGTQALTPERGALRYGVSVTDPCMDWETTERLLRTGHAALLPLTA